MLATTKMLQQTLCLSFLISSLIFSTLSDPIPDSNVYVQCSQLNFTSNTPYESNVNSLFTSLINSASLYNFNKFQTSSPQNDVVYGLFQCRGDVTSPTCKDCVSNAVSQLETTCPTSTGGQIQLEGCFVKYDNTSFFGAQEKTEVSKRCGPPMGYNSDVLNRIDAALANLVGGNGQYFFRDGDYGSIHGVAQCVQDLSLSDCQDCLSEASGRLRSECETSTWGDMYLGKCYIRYADQGNEILASNNGTSSSIKSNGGWSKNAWKWITAVGTLVTAGASIGGVTCYYKNSSQTINVVQNKIEIMGKNLEEKIEQVKKKVDDKKADKKDDRMKWQDDPFKPWVMPHPYPYYSPYWNPYPCN